MLGAAFAVVHFSVQVSLRCTNISDLSGDLVDECERHGIKRDAYVLDGAFLNIELMVNDN